MPKFYYLLYSDYGLDESFRLSWLGDSFIEICLAEIIADQIDCNSRPLWVL